jgi:ESS family glutamate:Na+ symporter
MQNFWEYDVWAPIALFGTLMISLLGANIVKRRVPFLRNSLIPTAVLGGLMLLIISSIYELCTDKMFFNTTYFGGNGASTLEIITYHALAIGFIATAFKPSSGKHSLKRNGEIFDTGVTTVSTYLLQGSLGMAITIGAAMFVMPDLFKAAGLILPFGYGQGTGQALNWGVVYEGLGFEGGGAFGLTIAAMGFLSAAIGGVLHLNIRKANGKLG